MEKVVHKYKDDYSVYIGRGSKWGNPFKIGQHGDRAEVIRSYARWITTGEGSHLLAHLDELEGQTLGCFCAPEGGLTGWHSPVCHGQVLLWLLAKKRGEA